MDARGRARVVLVHDWLTGMRGGEKCLEVVCRRWPSAPLFTLLHNPGAVSSVIEDRPPSGVPHVCYCFTPMRYAWHMRKAYFGAERSLKARAIDGLLAALREW